MSEVEKMYENAGVEPEYDYFTAIKYPKIVQYFHLNKNELVDNIVDKIKYCKKNILIKVIRVDKDYPDFTAEKQIAMLMFILNKFGDIGFQKMYSIRGNDESTRKDFIKCLCDCEHETWDSRPVDFYYQKGASGDNLKESLAGLINNLWKDLTESEQEQIRSILNG